MEQLGLNTPGARSRLQRGVTLHAALQNKSVISSGSRVTNSTVKKLRESDNRGGITVKTYKEHLLTIILLILIWN